MQGRSTLAFHVAEQPDRRRALPLPAESSVRNSLFPAERSVRSSQDGSLSLASSGNISLNARLRRIVRAASGSVSGESGFE